VNKNKLLELEKELGFVAGHLLYGDRNVNDVVDDSLEKLIYIIQNIIFAIVEEGGDDNISGKN